MHRILFGLLALVLIGCASTGDTMPRQTETAAPKSASLPDLGPAPELNNDTWLNVPSPLRIADLRGKVVLLEMWTFG